MDNKLSLFSIAMFGGENNGTATTAFLAGPSWNCGTGLPMTDPTTMPYTYKIGDYYRVGAVVSAYTHTVNYSGTDLNDHSFSVRFAFNTTDISEAITTTDDLTTALTLAGYTDANKLPATGTCGESEIVSLAIDNGPIKFYDSTDEVIGVVGYICTVTVTDTVTGGVTNYKPNGTTYTGAASTTAETNSVQIGDIYYYDGTQWIHQSNVDINIIMSSIGNYDATKTQILKHVNGVFQWVDATSTLDAGNITN